MLKLGLKTPESKASNIFSNIIKRESVGLWDINYSTLRLRRADDDFEKEFEPLSGLNVSEITDFHSWNLLNGSEYKDFLYDSPLGVDSNDDGVSDGWIDTVDSSAVTGSKEVIEDYQVLNITASTGLGSIKILKGNFSATAGDVYSVKCQGFVESVTGSFFGRLNVQWFNSSDSLISEENENFTNTTLDEIILDNIVAPVNTDYFQVRLYAFALSSGDTGKAYFKNAVLVKNDFIEDIGLLTQDDDSDGVANGWSYTSNGFDGTVVQSVDSTNGQKLEITSGGTNVNEAFLDTIIEPEGLKDGDILTLSVEARVSGNVIGRLRIDGLPTININSGSTFNNTDWQTITLSHTVINSNTQLNLKLRFRPVGVGDTGYIEYRNATLKQTNNSVYCTEIKDASGNGNHAVQSTASEQPRLVNAGTYEVDSNGDYSLYYDGTDDHFDITDNAGLDITSGGLSILSKHDPDADTGYIISRNGASSAEAQYGVLLPSGSNKVFSILEGAVRSEDLTSALTSKINLATYDFVNSKMYLDGTLKGTDPLTTALTSRANTQIGCRSSSVDGSTKSLLYEGHITAISVFDKALDAMEVSYATYLQANSKNNVWILNSDPYAFISNKYIWDDSETWDDNNLWKD